MRNLLRSIKNAGLKLKANLTQRSAEDYVAMQRRSYQHAAGEDAKGVSPGHLGVDNVVGSWAEHDKWTDFEDYLMKYAPKGSGMVALDYGCGPGRNLRRWQEHFARIDGVDISENNLKNARTFLQDLPPEKAPNLYLTTGMDCGDAPQGAYDFVFSSICMQHICVWEVRYSILKSLYDCLKPSGRISLQMGYGVPSPNTVDYHENFYQATGTNRAKDAAIASPDQPRSDLEKIGFTDFEHWIRPCGPGDFHPQWIFFTAVKPRA